MPSQILGIPRVLVTPRTLPPRSLLYSSRVMSTSAASRWLVMLCSTVRLKQLGHAVCEHAQRSLQHVSHCVGQERTGVLHLQVVVIEPNGLFYELTLAAAVSQWRVYFYHFLYFRRKPKSALFLLEFLP